MNTDILQMMEEPAGALQLTKTQSCMIADSVVERVEEGEINPLEAYVKLSFLQTAIDQAKKQIASLALDEAEKYGRKDFRAHGVDVLIKETGVKYDYSQDSDWRMYQEQIDELRTQQKALEVVLKAHGTYAKSSTTSVTITFDK